MIDSHAHLFEQYYGADLIPLLEQLQQKMEAVLVVGVDRKTSEEALRLAEQFDYLYAAAGLHPHEARPLTEKEMAWFESISGEDKLIALGETGLDYFYENSPREDQKKLSRQFIELADDINLPLILHVRPSADGNDAFKDIFEILAATGRKEFRGVFHCFSGNSENAKNALDFGFYCSFAGNLTFGNNPALEAAARHVPTDKILSETDSPYLAPQPKRGAQNRPDFVKHTIAKLAQLKTLDSEKLTKTINRNFTSLFFDPK